VLVAVVAVVEKPLSMQMAVLLVVAVLTLPKLFLRLLYRQLYL
jgi:hypothetical protein